MSSNSENSAAVGGVAVQTATAARRHGKFLTFALGAEEFGIEILKVHEIISSMPFTRIPGTPAHICGIVNLRGRVIPVMHLRRKFAMEDNSDGQSCIVVVQGDTAPIGIVVDRVTEVVHVQEQDVEDVPSLGASVDLNYLLGVAKVDGRVRLLLDIDRVASMEHASVAA